MIDFSCQYDKYLNRFNNQLDLAIKSLDNAKSKGLVHRNKVDREKSRLTLKVNKMESK